MVGGWGAHVPMRTLLCGSSRPIRPERRLCSGFGWRRVWSWWGDGGRSQCHSSEWFGAVSSSPNNGIAHNGGSATISTPIVMENWKYHLMLPCVPCQSDHAERMEIVLDHGAIACGISIPPRAVGGGTVIVAVFCFVFQTIYMFPPTLISVILHLTTQNLTKEYYKVGVSSKAVHKIRLTQMRDGPISSGALADPSRPAWLISLCEKEVSLEAPRPGAVSLLASRPGVPLDEDVSPEASHPGAILPEVVSLLASRPGVPLVGVGVVGILKRVSGVNDVRGGAAGEKIGTTCGWTHWQQKEALRADGVTVGGSLKEPPRVAGGSAGGRRRCVRRSHCRRNLERGGACGLRMEALLGRCR
ncbi:hypothetical protein KSP40_PGU016342 [Platanthera guangdongensis]|uniref:Uncharacterized protein n=1 Tax=Platanthera guangdongensis TaxID=2320717 RepID=A0ABR2LLU5_9ASPA